MAKKPYIKVICYNGVEKWNNRSNADNFYWDCVVHSEGSERDRYINILNELRSYKTVCEDGYTDKDRLREIKTDAPDGSRDYGDRTDWTIID